MAGLIGCIDETSLFVELFLVESNRGLCEKFCIGDVGLGISERDERLFVDFDADAELGKSSPKYPKSSKIKFT